MITCCMWLMHHYVYFKSQFLSPSVAQVPDDEQFVPDFQSDNCKYLFLEVLRATGLAWHCRIYSIVFEALYFFSFLPQNLLIQSQNLFCIKHNEEAQI